MPAGISKMCLKRVYFYGLLSDTLLLKLQIGVKNVNIFAVNLLMLVQTTDVMNNTSTSVPVHNHALERGNKREAYLVGETSSLNRLPVSLSQSRDTSGFYVCK